jgi:hypothetical protein
MKRAGRQEMLSKRIASAPVMDSYRNQVKEQVIQAMKTSSGRKITSSAGLAGEFDTPVVAAAGMWKTKLLTHRPNVENKLKKMTISESVLD